MTDLIWYFCLGMLAAVIVWGACAIVVVAFYRSGVANLRSKLDRAKKEKRGD